ncbi:phosphate acyltransferase PlsX [Tichowtungia aerotolerans]|uniref:Phosphate acyltransferase n=1 Tax=Tichowtungia aerotolerans TaxID=2697043 RepID=A0A6P1MBX4_9BACT|nr:phosphate acyltransferase PlsX [Tichowtungia aerotolerans]QHI69588.1 phosphate acyltransferase PlsX [Tichowtungia aerotolerans]
MRIAIDAMGGDFAPREIVKGAVEAARGLSGIEKLYLVGDEAAVQAELSKYGKKPECIEILHASEVIGMDESPALALRRKKDSSIMQAVNLVKTGEADAIFSAGSTGAAVAASTLRLRTLDVVDRPAIATVLPSLDHPFVLLDAGATTDCTAAMLVEFAAMGDIYAKKILNIQKPTVGLLSIGGEDAKGSKFTKEAFQLLESSPLNFIGNVESHDLFEGKVDVAVCDGFVGNVVLKTSESVSHAMGQWLKEAFSSSLVRKVGAGILKMSGAFSEIKEKVDPEAYGGAPLLGVKGVCIIGHGSSSSYAVYNAIRVAGTAIEQKLNHLIEEEINVIFDGNEQSE